MKKRTNIAILAFLGLCFNGKITAQEWVEYPQAIPTDYTLAAHDLVGKVKSVEMSLGIVRIKKIFNKDGNLVKEASSVPRNSLIEINRKEEYSYDKLKKLLTTTKKRNGKASTTYYQYDTSGRLLACNADKTGEKGESSRYNYDDSNRVVAIRFYQDNSFQNIHKIAYDAAGRIVKISNFRVEKDYENLRVVSNYTYNEKGQLLQTLSHSGGTDNSFAYYTYSETGQLISKKRIYEQDASIKMTSNYIYNKEGRLEKEAAIAIFNRMTVQDAIILYEYDQEGNWIKRTGTEADKVIYTETRIIKYY